MKIQWICKHWSLLQCWSVFKGWYLGSCIFRKGFLFSPLKWVCIGTIFVFLNFLVQLTFSISFLYRFYGTDCFSVLPRWSSSLFCAFLRLFIKPLLKIQAEFSLKFPQRVHAHIHAVSHFSCRGDVFQRLVCCGEDRLSGGIQWSRGWESAVTSALSPNSTLDSGWRPVEYFYLLRHLSYADRSCCTPRVS